MFWILFSILFWSSQLIKWIDFNLNLSSSEMFSNNVSEQVNPSKYLHESYNDGSLVFGDWFDINFFDYSFFFKMILVQELLFFHNVCRCWCTHQVSECEYRFSPLHRFFSVRSRFLRVSNVDSSITSLSMAILAVSSSWKRTYFPSIVWWIFVSIPK